MSQIKKKKNIKLLDKQSKAPQTPKLPLSPSIYVLPLFVMNFQRAIRTHHQKEVEEKTVKHSPNQHAKPEVSWAHPTKSIHVLPERLWQYPTYSEWMNHSKKKVEDQQWRWDRQTPQQWGHLKKEAKMQHLWKTLL